MILQTHGIRTRTPEGPGPVSRSSPCLVSSEEIGTLAGQCLSEILLSVEAEWRGIKMMIILAKTKSMPTPMLIKWQSIKKF